MMPDTHTSVTINVPWEIDGRITPNGRAHHMKKANLIRELRHTTDMACKEAGLHLGHDMTPPYRLHYLIVHQSKSKVMDDDNATAAMKPIRDQIASALGVDDRHITTGSVRQVVERGQAYVKVAIEEVRVA